MDVQLYSDLVESLLDTHFGMTPHQARLSDERLLYQARGRKIRPYQAVQTAAQAQGLVRKDLGLMGPYPPLDAADELAALSDVRAIWVLGEEPTSCGKCGTRTDFEEVSGNTLRKLESTLGFSLVTPQHHRCPNCGNEFLAEDDYVKHQ